MGKHGLSSCEKGVERSPDRKPKPVEKKPSAKKGKKTDADANKDDGGETAGGDGSCSSCRGL